MGSPPKDTPMRTVPRERMSSSMPAIDGTAVAATSATAATAVRIRFIIILGSSLLLSCCFCWPELRFRHGVLPEPVADLPLAPEIADLVVALGVDRVDHHAAKETTGQFVELVDGEFDRVRQRIAQFHGEHDGARS